MFSGKSVSCASANTILFVKWLVHQKVFFFNIYIFTMNRHLWSLKRIQGHCFLCKWFSTFLISEVDLREMNTVQFFASLLNRAGDVILIIYHQVTLEDIYFLLKSTGEMKATDDVSDNAMFSGHIWQGKRANVTNKGLGSMRWSIICLHWDMCIGFLTSVNSFGLQWHSCIHTCANLGCSCLVSCWGRAWSQQGPLRARKNP